MTERDIRERVEKARKWGKYGRWIISAALMYGVYVETGLFTAIAMTLLYIGAERPELAADNALRAIKAAEAEMTP